MEENEMKTKNKSQIGKFMEDFKSLLASYKIENVMGVGYQFTGKWGSMAIDEASNALWIAFDVVEEEAINFVNGKMEGIMNKVLNELHENFAKWVVEYSKESTLIETGDFLAFIAIKIFRKNGMEGVRLENHLKEIIERARYW